MTQSPFCRWPLKLLGASSRLRYGVPFITIAFCLTWWFLFLFEAPAEEFDFQQDWFDPEQKEFNSSGPQNLTWSGLYQRNLDSAYSLSAAKQCQSQMLCRDHHAFRARRCVREIEWNPCKNRQYFSKHSSFQSQLYNFQNPANCSDKKFLVLTKEWPGGFGSATGGRGLTIQLAHALGRIAIDAPYPHQTFPFGSPPYCDKDNVRRDCYFLPLTNCTLPDDWLNRSVQLSKKNQTIQHQKEQFVHNIMEWGSKDQFHSLAYREETTAPFLKDLLTPEYDYFRRAQYNYFVLRPNAKTIAFLDQYIQKIFPNGVPPRMATIFVRKGDKDVESPTFNLDLYIEELKKSDKNNEIKDVWIGSDSGKVIKQALAIKNSPYKWYGLQHKRTDAGIKWSEMTALFKRGGTELNLFTEQILAELYLSSLGNTMSCMYSSNWCRVILHLRDMNGRINYPFISMDAKGAEALNSSGIPNQTLPASQKNK